MISRNTVRELLVPFDISISDETVDRLIVYVNLLFRWNSKINLTSICTAEECITRHFGESFLASRYVQLRGVLLDIGSGAGFPGLAIKLIAPQLDVVLLEPVAKKRAFLKEVARACDMGPIEVFESRLDKFARAEKGRTFNIITARAVGGLDLLLKASKDLLRPNGHFCLWVGRQQVQVIREGNLGIQWVETKAIPGSRDRVILVGVRGN